MKYLVVLLCVCFAFSAELKAQDDPAPASREQEIENEQTLKAQSLSPDEPGPTEQRFVRIEKDVRHVLAGKHLRLQFGGLTVPSGIALGPSLQWQSSQDRVRANVWAIGSIREFYSVGGGMELPRLTSQRLTARLEAAHVDSPQLDFYGEGPNSLKSQRTNYRREDTRFDFSLNWPVARHVSPNCKAEQLFLNVGPGTSDAVTSTNLKFTAAQAPGLDVQSNFLIAGCGVRFDFRDLPDNPHKGTAVVLQGNRYLAEESGRYSFNRAFGSVEEYIPFFDRKRVIALHAAADMTFHNRDQVVPFYLQPTLGSFNDLRGFRPLRFYDENSFVMNAEYRWEIFTGLDFAIFGDAGEVFHRPAMFNIANLQKSGGFGIRFNNQRNLIMRVDTGFSREGVQVWAAFERLF
jgi:Omp85 superfamily domain